MSAPTPTGQTPPPPAEPASVTAARQLAEEAGQRARGDRPLRPRRTGRR